MNGAVRKELLSRFEAHYGAAPEVLARAPGRIEVLGNHTDYNEGFVLSAAIDLCTFFALGRSEKETCRLVAGDLMQETTFPAELPTRSADHAWANYVIGVLSGLSSHGSAITGFDGMFLSNIPLGAGLSSSAALEVSAALAICAAYDIDLDPLEIARIGQAAEHDFAGVKCGLLDQVTSLFGRDGHLVLTDFRSLSVDTVPIGPGACFLMCDTGVKHALVESEYNERRASCEEAARWFADALDHPVSTLRDVTWEEWKERSGKMDPVVARRAAHVIGENTRVNIGSRLLLDGDLQEFGRLMNESHESSRVNFENSCDELDCVVREARDIAGVLGARLSGGGFGGSVVLLVERDRNNEIASAIQSAFASRFDSECNVRAVRPSSGAGLAS